MSEKKAKAKRQKERQQAEEQAAKPRPKGMSILGFEIKERKDMGCDHIIMHTDLPSPDPQYPERKVVFVMTCPLGTAEKYVQENLGVNLIRKPKEIVKAEQPEKKIIIPRGPVPGLPM